LTGTANSYASAPALNLNSNNVTFSTWIKRNGLQPNYAGLIFCNGGGNRLGLGINGDQLYYIWDGQYYNWLSNQTVPNNEWTHVALVVTPNGAKMYMNGVATENVDVHPIQSFSKNLDFGVDNNDNSRVFNGQMDEVCIWNRALSETELRTFRHLTKQDTINDASLVAYYQFNEGSRRALDKKGSNNLTYSADAVNVISTAPVGGGTAEYKDVIASNIYNYATVGATLDFTGAATVPDGMVMISRLNIKPDTIASSGAIMHNQYWIVNNYGTNKTFSNLNGFSLTPSTSPTASIPANQVILNKRTDNAHINNWANLCTANSITPGVGGAYNFDNVCGISSFSQFSLSTNSPLSANSLQFSASKISTQQVMLNWKINEKSDVVRFELEKASNQLDFTTIDKQTVNGNTTFNFVDKTPYDGINNYKLKLYHANNTTSYSATEQIFMNFDANNFSISPNPVKAGEQIKIISAYSKKARLQFYNSNGKIVGDYFVNNQSTITIPQSWSAGIYYYALHTDSEIKSGKLSVK
jgi:hypothetical protein